MPEQMSLLDWQPPPELMQEINVEPPSQHVFKVGDRVIVEGVEGRVYHVNAGLWVSVGNVAKPYDPDQVKLWKPNPHAIAHWTAKLNFYTSAMSRLVNLQMSKGSAHHRTHEITRLQRFREECICQLKNLGET